MKYFLITVYLLLSISVFANTIIDSVDDNGRLIRTISFSSEDKESEDLSSIVLVFNTDGKLLSKMLFFNESYSRKSDIISQEQLYNKSEIITNYIISFAEDYYQISGIYKQIETVNENDEILEIEYFSKNGSIFKEKFSNRQEKFPFYTLSFIKQIMFEDYVDTPGRTNYGISAKYSSATSIVTFIEEPIDITEDDKDFVKLYFKSRNADNLIPMYNKKVLVQEKGKNYYILMQDQLLIYVLKNKKAAIKHYFGTRDTELICLCIGFTDI